MYISEKKKIAIKEYLIQKCGHREGAQCEACFKKHMFVDLMAESNIPVKYWFLKFKDFNGAPTIKIATQNYIDQIINNFINGQNLCYVGTYGTGKTYSICSILKHALMQKYSCYYTSLNDMVAYSMDYNLKQEFLMKTTQCDFLAIDEVDARHISDSDEAQKLFGSIFEKIIRYRVQNALPILIATNNASLDEVFSGQHKRVVESLGSSLQVIAAIGKDFRLQDKK